jgi:hypothetical protein
LRFPRRTSPRLAVMMEAPAPPRKSRLASIIPFLLSTRVRVRAVFRGEILGPKKQMGCPARLQGIRRLSLAIILSGSEINRLHNFLNPPICYDCSLCSAFSASGWEQ